MPRSGSLWANLRGMLFTLQPLSRRLFEESGKSKESKAKQEKQVMYLTADDFGNSIGGRKNIVRFIQAMRCDFNALYYELVVDGMVQLKDTHAKGFSPACWEELLSRIPGYFSQKYKGKGADGKTHPVCKNSWFMIHLYSLDWKALWWKLNPVASRCLSLKLIFWRHLKTTYWSLWRLKT